MPSTLQQLFMPLFHSNRYSIHRNVLRKAMATYSKQPISYLIQRVCESYVRDAHFFHSIFLYQNVELETFYRLD